MVSIHEIGHVYQGKVYPQYYSEYLADQFAIQVAKEDLEYLDDEWLIGSKIDILSHVCKAIRRKANLDNIIPDVIEYVNDVYNWEIFKEYAQVWKPFVYIDKGRSWRKNCVIIWYNKRTGKLECKVQLN